MASLKKVWQVKCWHWQSNEEFKVLWLFGCAVDQQSTHMFLVVHVEPQMWTLPTYSKVFDGYEVRDQEKTMHT